MKNKSEEKMSVMAKDGSVLVILARGMMGKFQAVYQGVFGYPEGELCTINPRNHGVGLFWLEAFSLSGV
jgi:hypothetical protein